MTWGHFRGQIHFEMQAVAKFLNRQSCFPSFERKIFNTSTVFAECLYGHHVVAPTVERYIFQRRKPKSGLYWWLGVIFRGKNTLECKELPNFSPDTRVSRNSNRKSSIVFDGCIYGHHIVAPTTERYIFRRRKTKFRPYWWLGVTFRGKYTLKYR